MRTRHRTPCRAFTLVEIVVVGCIAAILLALLTAGISRVIKEGKQVKCASNLRNIWVACLGYASDNDGKMPPNAPKHLYTTYIRPYLREENLKGEASRDRSVLVCPAEERPYYMVGYGLSYGMNTYIHDDSRTFAAGSKPSVWKNPSQLAVLYDLQDNYIGNITTWIDPNKQPRVAKRHGGRINVVFGDGHIEPVAISKVPTKTPSKFFWQGRD